MRVQLTLRTYTALLLLVALMVAIAVLGGNGGIFSDGETLPPSLAVDRIAFVDLDRRIMTVAHDGRRAVHVADVVA